MKPRTLPFWGALLLNSLMVAASTALACGLWLAFFTGQSAWTVDLLLFGLWVMATHLAVFMGVFIVVLLVVVFSSLATRRRAVVYHYED